MTIDKTVRTSPKILISIINYRTTELTIQAAQSVLDDMVDIDGMVAIVDNASNDGSSERLQGWKDALPKPERVMLVRSPINSGFSGGHNQGVEAANADYYLFMNSDAVVKPGFFNIILQTADALPKAGLFAPRIDFDDGEQQISCFRFHSPASELIRGANSGPVTKLLKRHDVPLVMNPNMTGIDWASFACILLRGDMVRALGPMDEGYFLYFEDVEYCWRARKAGWDVAYVPEAKAVHFRGGSGPVKALQKARKRLPKYFYASRTRMLYQFYGPFGLLCANVAWVLGRGLACARACLGKAVPPSNQAEWRDLWINFLSPLGDRYATKE